MPSLPRLGLLVALLAVTGCGHTDADGRLDEGAPDRAQSDYERILEAGLRENRIERVDGRFRVRVQSPDA